MVSGIVTSSEVGSAGNACAAGCTRCRDSVPCSCCIAHADTIDDSLGCVGWASCAGYGTGAGEATGMAGLAGIVGIIEVASVAGACATYVNNIVYLKQYGSWMNCR